MMAVITALIAAGSSICGVLLVQIAGRKKTTAETMQLEATARKTEEETESLHIENTLTLNEILKRQKAVEEATEDIRHEIKNTHTTNIRVDIDNLMTALSMQAEAYARDREIAKKQYQETLDFRRSLSSQIQALSMGHMQNAEEIKQLKMGGYLNA
ncbi:hypothetical protein [Mobiluncus curtisii]|uniref:hypothetical protein n=1 Tax=Mobiluncus curtisii TaxID=2051 RepID=UPI00242EA6BB|nr:hypothetical protein [Mobiluncus curtisii]